MLPMQRFIMEIEGPNFKDVNDVELPRPPRVGETIESKYGTCIVVHTEPLPESNEYSGRIVCRLP
jgi:hypothetical protein